MPNISGFQVLEALRADRQGENQIPVLVLTAKDLSVEDQKRLNGYVEQVMRKSASELSELLRELGRMLPRSIERGKHAKVKEILA